MKPSEFEIRSSRRSFLKKGALATGAAVVGAGLFSANQVAFGQESRGSLTKGDIAILRFLAAAELIESDLWTQYAELGGLTPGQVPVEVNPNQPMNAYQAALSNLDPDGPQYIRHSHAGDGQVSCSSSASERTLRTGRCEGVWNRGVIPTALIILR